MTTDITIREDGYALTKPTELVELATILRDHIKAQNLYTMIRGKAYPHVEAWQFAGACIGLLPVVEDVENLSTENEFKYRASVSIVDANGIQRGRGVAICSNAESTKSRFDEYAIASMAQTRAVGKAYRLAIGWILKTAGYEATPAEEMECVEAETPKYTGDPAEYIMPMGQHKGAMLGHIPLDNLERAKKWCVDKGTDKTIHAELIEQIDKLLELTKVSGAPDFPFGEDK